MVGEMALVEMRRMLSPHGLRLVVGWRGAVERESGPPNEVLDGRRATIENTVTYFRRRSSGEAKTVQHPGMTLRLADQDGPAREANRFRHLRGRSKEQE